MEHDGLQFPPALQVNSICLVLKMEVIVKLHSDAASHLIQATCNGKQLPEFRNPQGTPRSPAGRQSPEAGSHQLDGISCGIAEIDGLPPSGPFHFQLDGNSVCEQMLPPAFEVFRRNSQGEMPGPGGPVCRENVPPPGRLREEDKQDIGLADLKKDVMSRFFSDLPQAENLPVKPLGRIQIIRINAGFDHGMNGRRHGE